MEDPAATLPIGYPHAKWCCEKVVESAQHAIPHEIESMVIRFGQLSGSQTTEFWSQKEHLPALIKACQDIRAVLDLQGVSSTQCAYPVVANSQQTLSWVPVDRAAQVAMELMLSHELTALVYHLENPIRQPWSELCTLLENELSIPFKQRIPFQEWLDRVADRGDAVLDGVSRASFFAHVWW